jgi:hypothetical protein
MFSAKPANFAVVPNAVVVFDSTPDFVQTKIVIQRDPVNGIDWEDALLSGPLKLSDSGELRDAVRKLARDL